LAETRGDLTLDYFTAVRYSPSFPAL
jgi:hypothetical protein